PWEPVDCLAWGACCAAAFIAPATPSAAMARKTEAINASASVKPRVTRALVFAIGRACIVNACAIGDELFGRWLVNPAILVCLGRIGSRHRRRVRNHFDGV